MIRPGLLALVLAAFAAAAHAQTPAEERVWIDLRSPQNRTVQRIPVGMIEVQGATGAGRPHYHDVAVVVDLSASTRLRSGVDVNENGRVGKAAPEIREDYWGSASPQELCDDPGDTIAAAEIAAVRRLLSLLDPERTRVALIAFGDRGELMAPLSATRAEVVKALDVLDGRHGWYGGTNYAAALETARTALLAAPAAGGQVRRRSILFLSDGYPTLPPPEPLPGKAAIAAARESAAAEMHVHSFALGPEAVRGRDVLDLMSRISQGSLTEIDRPGDVLFHLPSVELSEVAEIQLENVTTKQPGRAIRLLADGSFDGFVPLTPGKNELRISAIGIGGGRADEHRTVSYEPAAGSAQEIQLEVSRLRQLLRDRTVAVELAEEIQRVREQRRARQRELKLEVERKSPDGGASDAPK